MSITELVQSLVCETLECKENPCPYIKDKSQCPKQIDCSELCTYMCPLEEDDDRTN